MQENGQNNTTNVNQYELESGLIIENNIKIATLVSHLKGPVRERLLL